MAWGSNFRSKAGRRLEMRKFFRDERGASAAEYVFLLAILGVAILSGVGYLGTALGDAMNDAGTAIAGG
jgi:pilus assembly protein Flp/PilA